jgi:hypothetical protein
MTDPSQAVRDGLTIVAQVDTTTQNVETGTGRTGTGRTGIMTGGTGITTGRGIMTVRGGEAIIMTTVEETTVIDSATDETIGERAAMTGERVAMTGERDVTIGTVHLRVITAVPRHSPLVPHHSALSRPHLLGLLDLSPPRSDWNCGRRRERWRS